MRDRRVPQGRELCAPDEIQGARRASEGDRSPSLARRAPWGSNEGIMRHGRHLLLGLLLLGVPAGASGDEPLPVPRPVADAAPPGKPIDLASALRLAGV